jgi:hypothetical protein
MLNEIFGRTRLKEAQRHNTSFVIFNTFMFTEIFGRGSLKDYCPVSIVKEEAD